MRNSVRFLLVLLVAGSSILAVKAQTPGERLSVKCWAEVQSGPPRITVKWEAFNGATGYQVFRKLKGATSWGGTLASLGASAVQYIDDSPLVGTSYEYKVVRSTTSSGSGYGYVNSGIGIPMVEYRGKVILLVDDLYTAPLATQLTTTVRDLEGDGWTVLRYDVSRTAPVPSIRSLVVNAYNSDPQNVKAVFIIGHVPVPYSGNLAPDGHGDHYGAWCADVHYGDVNGTWTDNSVNNTNASGTRNDNVPGDGKYDQSTIPSEVELAVGRVDLYDLPAFSQNEYQLTAAYLDKLHAWKVKQITAQTRGVIHDNFASNAEGFGQNGWRGFSPLVHPNNVTAGNYFSTLTSQSHIWSYACGPGWWDNIYGVGSTQQFANSNVQTIFTGMFGSYFGDWDSQNNFLRAALASGTTLCNFWAGMPNWFIHHMGLGETIGYSTVLSQNNVSHYETTNWQTRRVHIALMGDPTLRMHIVAPPSNVQIASPNSSNAVLNWTGSSEPFLLGYHVYRYNGQSWERRTQVPVLATSFTDNTTGLSGTIRYMVRALKPETTPSGTYQNLSIGAQGEVVIASEPVDCLGVVNGTALPGTACNDGDPCTVNDTWNSSCACVGTPLPCVDADACSVAVCVNGICTQTPVPDVDGDGACDAIDGCPNDPNKIEPGLCGCGSAEPGTACDDGDPLTVQDMVNTDCICQGVVVDCNGVPGGGAVYDNCGVCGGDNDCIVASTCFTLGDPIDPDVEEAEDGSIHMNVGSLDLVLDGSSDPWRGEQVVGLRFPNITVPQQAPIINAYVQFTARPGNGNNADPSMLEVTMEASDDAEPMGFGAFDLSARDRTGGILWNPTAWNQPNEAADPQRTPNLSSIVQEVINRPGWVDGNAMVVLLEGSGRRAAYSRNQSQSRAARLCISYGIPPIDCNGVPGGGAVPGSSCDDGDPATGNDSWTADCTCEGIPLDCAGNPGGNALPGTPCDDADPDTGNDEWDGSCNCVGIPIDCTGEIGGTVLPGTPCDDGLPLTVDDAYDDQCNCVGIPSLLDCLGVFEGGALPGTPCDDGDPTTGADMWTDQCECIGQALDCTGQPGGSAMPGSPCDDGDPETVGDSWSADCTCEGVVLDCLGAVDGPAMPGTPCDDQDPDTQQDVWTEECVCAGIQLDCLGIPGGTAIPGSPCDDGDPDTVDDHYGSDCTCAGLVLDCLLVPGGGALPGTPCDDDDALTGNDMWTAECTCVGLPLDCNGTPGGTAVPGSPCDDGDPLTGADTWSADCNCEGALIDCQGVPGGSDLPGTSCDDGLPATGNDTWTANCQCIGQVIDCLGVPGGTALPSTPCDDGDPLSEMDTWNAQCECVGLLMDCAGVLNGTAFIDNCGDCVGGTTGQFPDPDQDLDGVLDCDDVCISVYDPLQLDFDEDGIGNLCDNCPWIFNPDQTDTNGNQVGDACDEVGMGEIGGLPLLSVHPNPTGSWLFISWNDPRARTIVVHDMLANVLVRTAFASSVDLSDLPQGAYFIMVLDDLGLPLGKARVVRL